MWSLTQNRVLPALSLLCLVAVILYIAQSHNSTTPRYERLERGDVVTTPDRAQNNISSLASISESSANATVPTETSTTKTDPSSTSVSTTTPEAAAMLSELSGCLPEPEFRFVKQHFKPGGGSSRMLHVYAAFQLSNRIITVTSAGQWFEKLVFCRYFDADGKELGRSLASIIYPDFVVHCCLRPGAKFMSITKESNSPVNRTVPIEVRALEPKHKISSCLDRLFGEEPKTLLIAQLVEHNRLQGVDQHYIYVQNLDENAMKLVRYYEKQGDATVIDLPVDHFRDRLDSLHFAIQDCNQRTKQLSRYAIVHDFDELITPRVNITLFEYARKKFEEDEHREALHFRVRWVLRNPIENDTYNGNETLNDLPLMRYHNTSSFAPQGDTAKCLIDPLKVMSSWIHYPTATYGNTDWYEVPIEDGYVRHYRESPTWDRLKVVEGFGNFTNTNYPETLLPLLLRNVKTALDAALKQ